MPLFPLTCRNGMPLEREPIGDLIGDLMVRDNLMEAFVMAALPPAAAAWRVIEWPAGLAVPDDPLKRFVNSIPFPCGFPSRSVRP